MKRYVFALSLAAPMVLACVDVSNSRQSLPVLEPILDSLFVGDMIPPRRVFLIDASGSQTSPGTVKWFIRPETVATIDAVSGAITGVAKGTAIVLAAVGNDTGVAIVAVSRPLDLTPLLDTIYLMPNDTITVPVAIQQRTPGPTTLQFDPSPDPGVYDIDAAGLVTAHATGGPVRYHMSLTDGTTTVTDSGAVAVLTPTDTSESGQFYMTAFGTAIRHQSGGALAVRYTRLGNKLTFQLADTLTRNNARETVLITLQDSVLNAGIFEIDSISQSEAEANLSTLNPFCNPPRPWARWSSTPLDPRFGSIIAYSHGTATSQVAGQLGITQIMPAPVGGGSILSGRYVFRAQRRDLYGDPLGLETIRGTFVVPLLLRNNICPG